MIFETFDTTEDFVERVTKKIADFIQATIKTNNICHMIFPGGNSPRPIFEKLKQADLPWSKLHLYPSDERCVPIGSEERNDRIIDELLITSELLPENNLHRIPAELGPEVGATFYHEFLNTIPRFDLALLGMGPDGHTASLFPGHVHPSHKNAYPVVNSPKPPTERVTISLERLKSSQERWVIIRGEEKKDIVKQIKQGASIPITDVMPTLYFLEQS